MMVYSFSQYRALPTISNRSIQPAAEELATEEEAAKPSGDIIG